MLAELQKSCSQKAADWEERKSSRQKEQIALQERYTQHEWGVAWCVLVWGIIEKGALTVVSFREIEIVVNPESSCTLSKLKNGTIFCTASYCFLPKLTTSKLKRTFLSKTINMTHKQMIEASFFFPFPELHRSSKSNLPIITPKSYQT